LKPLHCVLHVRRNITLCGFCILALLLVIDERVQEENKALRTEIAHNEAFYPQAQAMAVVQFELTRKVETMFERLAPLYASHPLLYQEAESMLKSSAVALQIAISNMAQILG
jgi:hypothetical protein